MGNNKIKYIIICAIVLILFTITFYLVLLFIPPVIEDVTVSEINENNQVTLKIKIKKYLEKKVYCQITKDKLEEKNWQLSKNNECSFDVDAGNYNIYLKQENKILKEYKTKEIKIDKILEIKPTRKTLYLPLEGTSKIEVEILSLGDVDKTLTYEYNEEIIKIENDTITALKEGTTEVIMTSKDNIKASINVIVTSLIKKQYVDNNRAKVSCGMYTEEQAHFLDTILAERLEYVGIGTRAAAVEAARFLTMTTQYKIPYFFENGRLNNHPGRPRADGEGRYFHKGLFLSTDKYADLVAIKNGPAMWGCPLMNHQTEYGFVAGRKYPNGLSCSGFISWALYNGGLDIKDSGAGDFTYRDDDLCDLGEQHELTYELMASGKVRVGDLIGRDGHIAIIVGLDETNIYIAESLVPGVNVETFERYKGVVDSNLYGYIMLMDTEYNGDGKLTDMWTY